MRKSVIVTFVFTLILSTTQVAHSAVPAIDLGIQGAAFFRSGAYEAMDLHCKVVDHDGVYGGDNPSHVVKVTVPGMGSFILNNGGQGGPVAEFWRFINPDEIPSGFFPNEPPFTVTVTFEVTDLVNVNIVTAEDNLTWSELPVPDQNSFEPSLVGTSVTANFDDVEVRHNFGEWVAYDNFSGVLSDTLWNLPNSDPGAEIVEGNLRLAVQNAIGTRGSRLQVPSGNDITGIKTKVQLISPTDAGGKPYATPKARIAGYFFHNYVNGIWCRLDVYPEKVVFVADEDHIDEAEQRTWWITLKEETLIEGDFIDQLVEISMYWDGDTMHFGADVNADGSYEAEGSWTPDGNTQSIFGYQKRLEARLSLSFEDSDTEGTTPEFSWDPVDGANRYRVRIYTVIQIGSERVVWSGYTGNETSYRMPPGALKANSEYYYRIDAYDNHIAFEQENISKAPESNDRNYRFFTGEETQTPHIELDSLGVQTWNSETYDPWPMFWIKVHDAAGVPGNIKSVEVKYPDNTTRSLIYDGYVSPTCGYYRYFGDSPVISGTYTFKVVNKADYSYSTVDFLDSNPIGYPANGSISLVPYTVLGATAAEFDWEDVPGAAFYRVEIYKDSNRIYTFVTTESNYSLAEGFLKDDAHYEWRITTRREFFDENVDNASAKLRFPIATTVTYTDTDSDGLADDVDIDTPPDIGKSFSDGTTSGEVRQGSEFLTITDAPFPDKGVWITATGGTAIIDICDYTSELTLDDGDQMLATCGSVTSNILKGAVEMRFFSDNGQEATVSLSEGNGLTFEPNNSSFTAPATNADPVSIMIDGEDYSVEVGSNVIPIDIDIKPGSYPNCFNQNEHGALPVAILGRSDLDVAEIDVASLEFQGLIVKVRGKGKNYLAHYEDVNDDGYLDLVVKFEDSDGWIYNGSGKASVTGKLTTGNFIKGIDTICIIP